MTKNKGPYGILVSTWRSPAVPLKATEPMLRWTISLLVCPSNDATLHITLLIDGNNLEVERF